MESLTIEEKIGQLFLISVRNSYSGNRMLFADDYMKNIIEQYKPGGIILFTINFADPVQTRDLIRGTQELSSIPLFIAVDEEGGKVARLGNTDRMSVTKIPQAAVIGRTGNREYARLSSQVISRELKAFGFNMNMAPVADVNTNARNPVIGDRTYSSDPLQAGRMVAEVVRTMADENIISVLKHFPGHGDTSSDSHKGDVTILHDLQRLEKVEFVPFRMGIEAGADAVMTAHIKMPLVTGNDLPATMSPLILQGILRNEMGFKGIIITDAMDMGAVKNYWSADEAAVNAIKAGADIILMPASLSDAVQGIRKALEDGVLTEERINESVRRILRVKVKRGILDQKSIGSDQIMDIIGSTEHARIIDSIIN
ncbi:glycoside hydrolase family 3 protein [Spirochaeta isovalerica]|uniref:beta-N-acetylhexosaminidase n=1 Tax=Spirochaeta isovalerica TaxID=150 RepID=A0A841RDH7_9SPIO|nr:glycoside hydrolase family 3 protein [Spirochaeta isovalerica]MBB6481287.1 beta-N-acetylhexosaminidase [Spirochaeta isovalerica]